MTVLSHRQSISYCDSLCIQTFGYIAELGAESCDHELTGCTFIFTILFFLWGFGYGLLDTLNSHFQDVLNTTAGRSSGLQASYFAAYFLCPLTISGWICRKYGFRVVGAGLSTLETAADPEIRLNLGQAVQGVGTFIGPLLASRVFFANTVNTEAGLKNVQWTYLAIACFVVLLIILFWLAPFPEITDADQAALESMIADSRADPGSFRKQYTLFLGVWSQFCYVGAQAAVTGYFINFCEEAGRSSLKSSQGLYAFMRFVSGGLMMLKPFKPRIMLLVFFILCTLFSILAIVNKGTTSIVMITLVLCFESLCFATIFSLSLRGLGQHTKLGGSLLVAAISGGMVFPPMMGAIVTNVSAHTSMVIPMMGYILALSFPIYVNLYKRDVMDLHRDTEVNVTKTLGKNITLEEGTQSKPATANVETVEGDKAVN
ncbi:uncharacterized protein N7483_001377 [Penicillium malachiteum]|uniref:uncharacterized protein n=1 Tax=Penicillium malachiteum TaxID=1324776 RepID=UPI00254854AC|nr:uncharacterized protein N7483_001377 [Penicillium malachiteum]KAJ5736252.1 hypothetical protein N7483_001377 [Penicillium malachiteum]